MLRGWDTTVLRLLKPFFEILSYFNNVIWSLVRSGSGKSSKNKAIILAIKKGKILWKIDYFDPDLWIEFRIVSFLKLVNIYV